MKNSKIVLVALMLVCAPTLFAQTQFHRLDTVRILPPTDKHYLTSEKLSPWVYNVNHVIQQVGGKRFPNGILVQGIYSWIAPEFLKMVSPYVEKDSTVTVMSEEQRAAYRAQQAEERRIRDSIANAKAKADALSYAELRRKQDSAFAAQQAEEVRRRAYEDSLAQARLDSLEKTMAPKEIDRFTIGVRGGAASMMQDLGAVGKGKVGFDVALDLQYAHYWPTKKENNVGLLVGLSAAFARNSLKGPETADYTLPTCDGDIAYHIQGDVNSLVMNQIQIEVPVMFSLVTKKGFFLNIGPKLMAPVYSPYKQDLSVSDITATFVKEGVTAVNEVVTGVFPGDKAQMKGQWHNAAIHVLAAGELGGEIKLKDGDSFGIGVYGSYSLFNNYKQLEQPVPSYVQITAPTATSCAIVDVKGVSDVHMNKLGYWDAGIKLAYHFNWYHKPNKK